MLFDLVEQQGQDIIKIRRQIIFGYFIIIFLINCPWSLSFGWLQIVLPCQVILLFDCDTEGGWPIYVALKTIFESSLVVMAFLLVVTVLAIVIDVNGMESVCVAITTHVVELGQLLVLTTKGTMTAPLLVGVKIALKPSLKFVAGIAHYIW